MKKKSIILFIIILSIILISCEKEDSFPIKAMEQGKLALAEGEYDKALGLLKAAIDEGFNDTDGEIKKIIDIIESYKKGKKAFEEGDLESSKEILDNIDIVYKKYSIKDDIETLKKDLDEKIKERDTIKEDEKLDTEETQVEEEKIINKEVEQQGVLLKAYTDNWIYLDGNGIINGDKKEISIDVNNDNSEEYFSISRDTPNGTKVLAIANDFGMNLMNQISISPEHSHAFDEWGEINPDFGIQITILDLDNDGIDEVLLSIGDNLVSLDTFIFQYTNSTKGAFDLIGSIYGQEKHYISKDNSIRAPYGSQGLFESYKYGDGILYINE